MIDQHNRPLPPLPLPRLNYEPDGVCGDTNPKRTRGKIAPFPRLRVGLE
jgi:hypothetical protein